MVFYETCVHEKVFVYGKMFSVKKTIFMKTMFFHENMCFHEKCFSWKKCFSMKMFFSWKHVFHEKHVFYEKKMFFMKMCFHEKHMFYKKKMFLHEKMLFFPDAGGIVWGLGGGWRAERLARGVRVAAAPRWFCTSFVKKCCQVFDIKLLGLLDKIHTLCLQFHRSTSAKVATLPPIPPNPTPPHQFLPNPLGCLDPNAKQ